MRLALRSRSATGSVRRAAGATFLAAALALSTAAGRPPAAPGQGPAPTDGADLYAQLQAAELRPAGHLRDAEITVDRAALQLQDGELYLLEPVAGRSTGAVFLGRGRFRLQPPDAVEGQQLDKYLDDERVDLQIKAAVLRFADDTAERLVAQAGEPRRPDLGKARKTWRQRHEKARDDRLIDLDARIVQALLDGGPDSRPSDYFYAEIDGKDWFTFELEPFNMEEIRLYKSHGANRRWDNWTAFHRLQDYPADGGAPLARIPALESWRPVATVPDIAVDVAVDGDGDLEATAELRVRIERPTRTLWLGISPVVEIESVSWTPGPVADPWPPADWAAIATGEPDAPHGPQGEPLDFLQAHVGRGLDEDRWDPRVTVLLPRTLEAGEELLLAVRYKGELFERLSNRDYFNRDTRGWYPQHLHARRSRFHMVFRTPDRYRVATGGELQQELERDGTRIERRATSRPVVGMAFQYGALDPEVYEEPGQPRITVFSSPNMTGFSPGNRQRVLDDLRGATALYTDYFGLPSFQRLVVTETPALGGQSFDGFLLLSFGTFGSMHTGEAELFRTHELAHQWWGNSVSWTSYRDQWMSEGFAQYAAALHRLHTEGADEFSKMMSAWRKDVLAKPDLAQRFGMRNYGFSPEALRDSDGNDSGPVWVGFRLASDKTPNDYRILVYEKGAYILHMLRMMLYDWETGEDLRFRRMMREFHRRHRGGHASTEDFLAAVNQAFGEPMDWFFDQWVYGTEVPEYDEDLDFERDGSRWRLVGTLEQKKVTDGFRMPVPLRVAFKDGSERVVTVWVDGPRVEVDLALAGRPDKVEINPLFAVLAR